MSDNLFIVAKDFIGVALERWRESRDELFKKYGLDMETIYKEGNFEKLPASCLMAVCYVDAYASMLKNFEHFEAVQAEIERRSAVVDGQSRTSSED